MAETIIKERLIEREKALNKARLFAYCVKKRLGSSTTVILFGSYARGDFSAESDVDILVVTNSDLPFKPHERIDLILDCIRKNPEIEPVLLTVKELEERYAKKNPLVVEALSQGIYLLDELRLREKFSSRARRRGQAY